MSKMNKLLGLIMSACGIIITYAVIFESHPPNLFVHILALLFGISIILFGIGVMFKENNETADKICYFSFIALFALTLIFVGFAIF